jgi:adenylylsulfate kinase-like enzyme
LNKSSKIFWITGLSGSGKTSLAIELSLQLRKQGIPLVILDGDELRDIFFSHASAGNIYDRETRLLIAMKYSYLCKMIASQGVTVVIATISLFKEIHDWNRKNLPGYIEIYLKVPLIELRRRDPKLIYKRFDSGELSNIAGLDLIIDEPVSPDLIFEFDPLKTVYDILAEVNLFLESKQ